MADPGPILILGASTGAGHMVAARALEQAARELAPDRAVQVHDVLRLCNSLFRAVYGGGYLTIAHRFPAGMGLLYDMTDFCGPPSFARLALQRMHTARARRWIERRRPALVINTHFLPAEIVALARRAGRLDCPQVTVTTDLEAHPMWLHAPTERYYAATELSKAGLVACGADEASVRVCGIPVRAEFLQLESREECRRQLQRPLERQLILVLSGGFGVGPTAALLDQLAAAGAGAQIVVIAGANEGLRQRLRRRAARGGVEVDVLGYTGEMHLWMRAADVVISKPGGLTCAEAMVCGTPLVIVSPIPGPESRNNDCLLSHGAAVKVNHPRLLGYVVRKLLSDAPGLAEMRAAMARLGRPSAAHAIVRDALTLLK